MRADKDSASWMNGHRQEGDARKMMNGINKKNDRQAGRIPVAGKLLLDQTPLPFPVAGFSFIRITSNESKF